MPSPSEVIFKNWDSPLFYTLWYETSCEKTEKNDDPEIFHCKQMGKETKPNQEDTSAKVGVQQIFSLHRQYRLSVAVWWYFLVSLWVKLFVLKGLIQAFLACLKDIGWFVAIYPARIEKHQLVAKTTKMENSPHINAV